MQAPRSLSHHALFTSKPEAIPTPSLLIIDESFWRAGIRGGDEGHPVVVSEDQIASRPYKTKAVGGDDLFGTADLDATLTPIIRAPATGDLFLWLINKVENIG